MTKIKKKLIEKFLPIYLRESLIKENEQLRMEVVKLQRENRALTAYIDGLEYGVRNQRRIVIYGGHGGGEKG